MATRTSPAARWRNDRLFYSGMGLAVAVATVIGFAPSYYLSHWFDPPVGTPQITATLLVHGAVFTGWVALSAIQPLLIAGHRRALHRRLGYFGAALALAAFVLGNVAAVRAMHGGFIGLGDPLAFYAIPFFDMVFFAAFVALVVAQRNRPEAHKRLMLLANTQIVEAAFARAPYTPLMFSMPAFTFVAADLIIAAGITYDLVSRGRVHPVWLWGGGVVIAGQFGRIAIMTSEPWLAFARMMYAL